MAPLYEKCEKYLNFLIQFLKLYKLAPIWFSIVYFISLYKSSNYKVVNIISSIYK